MKKEALIIDVSHGTTHDGPGMRTTVFFKGCPLRCQWCQNPESIAVKNETWWSKNDCIGCLTCVSACPNEALECHEEGIKIHRHKCKSCGTCVEECPSTAMDWQAKTYDMDTLVKEVLRDKVYYQQFQGGVTCSGGEPLLQSDFVAEFFKVLQAEGVSTALDTCGFVQRKKLEMVLPYTDYILYDIKLFDSEKHKQFTGVSNELILQNLLFIADFVRTSKKKTDIWIRTPLIPNATADMENIMRIGEFIRNNLSDVVTRWELCAFNGSCVSKYDKIQENWLFEGQRLLTQAQLEPIKQIATSFLKEKVLITGMICND